MNINLNVVKNYGELFWLFCHSYGFNAQISMVAQSGWISPEESDLFRLKAHTGAMALFDKEYTEVVLESGGYFGQKVVRHKIEQILSSLAFIMATHKIFLHQDEDNVDRIKNPEGGTSWLAEGRVHNQRIGKDV